MYHSYYNILPQRLNFVDYPLETDWCSKRRQKQKAEN